VTHEFKENIFLISLIFVCLLRGDAIYPFCAKVKKDPLETECTDDRSSVALCNLVEHVDPLPKIYQVLFLTFASLSDATNSRRLLKSLGVASNLTFSLVAEFR